MRSVSQLTSQCAKWLGACVGHWPNSNFFCCSTRRMRDPARRATARLIHGISYSGFTADEHLRESTRGPELETMGPIHDRHCVVSRAMSSLSLDDQKIPCLYGTRKLITVFTKVHHWSQINPFQPLFL
jgi:hypothetical protein